MGAIGGPRHAERRPVARPVDIGLRDEDGRPAAPLAGGGGEAHQHEPGGRRLLDWIEDVDAEELAARRREGPTGQVSREPRRRGDDSIDAGGGIGDVERALPVARATVGGQPGDLVARRAEDSRGRPDRPDEGARTAGRRRPPDTEPPSRTLLIQDEDARRQLRQGPQVLRNCHGGRPGRRTGAQDRNELHGGEGNRGHLIRRREGRLGPPYADPACRTGREDVIGRPDRNRSGGERWDQGVCGPGSYHNHAAAGPHRDLRVPGSLESRHRPAGAGERGNGDVGARVRGNQRVAEEVRDLGRRGGRGTGPLRLGAEHLRRTGGGVAVPGEQQRDNEADHGKADDDQRGRHLPAARGFGPTPGCPLPGHARRWLRVRWLRERALGPDQIGGHGRRGGVRAGALAPVPEEKLILGSALPLDDRRPGWGHRSVAIALNRVGRIRRCLVGRRGERAIGKLRPGGGRLGGGRRHPRRGHGAR